jgi:hypothetical protein
MAVETGDPFLGGAHVRLVEIGPERAVAEQEAAPELDNHVGVRHASALHAAGYAASRALVTEALGAEPGAHGVRLAGSEISYVAMGLGPLTSTAARAGDGWDDLRAGLASGVAVELASTVTTVDGAGKAVAKLELSWVVEPGAAATG